MALGLAPVTVCTDLLKPGGYGRLPKYLENLEERMRGLGVRTVGDYVAAAGARRGRRPVARATADPRYRAEALRPPRRIGRHLALFDCINCDKCLPACPNDANFVYETEPLAREYESYRVEGGRAVPVAGGRFEVRERHQIANFQDFCNDCGNCDTFCPEDGGPYLEKPRFFGSLAAWRRQGDARRLLRRGAHGRDAMWGRLRGVEYRLEVDRAADRGRLHGRARDARAAPPRAHAGRSVRRSRHARRPHAGRRRLPDDGRPARRRSRPAPRQPRERDGRRPVNLLLLAPDEVRDDGTALLTGRRHEHARAVLRVQAGETLRVGVRGGKCGTGEVLSEGADGLLLRVTLDAEPPPRAGVSLVLAMPRPKALRRVIPAVASLGVDRVVLVNAARVEKSYFDSKVLAPAFLDGLVDLGLEQARDTRPPADRGPRAVPALRGGRARRLGRRLGAPGAAPGRQARRCRGSTPTGRSRSRSALTEAGCRSRWSCSSAPGSRRCRSGPASCGSRWR